MSERASSNLLELLLLAMPPATAVVPFGSNCMRAPTPVVIPIISQTAPEEAPAGLPYVQRKGQSTNARRACKDPSKWGAKALDRWAAKQNQVRTTNERVRKKARRNTRQHTLHPSNVPATRNVHRVCHDAQVDVVSIFWWYISIN